MIEPELLENRVLDLLERGVRLKARGDRLHVDTPIGQLKLEDIEFLISCKQEILELLHDLQRPRLTSSELGNHLLEQAVKAAASAQHAAQPHAACEWARWARLWSAAMQLLGVAADLTPWSEFAAQFLTEPGNE